MYRDSRFRECKEWVWLGHSQFIHHSMFDFIYDLEESGNGNITVIRILITYLVSYSMKKSPSWEANVFSAIQEIPPILWNPNVHSRSHKCPPPVLIQSISRGPRLSAWTFRNKIWFYGVMLAPRPNPQAGGRLLTGSPLLLIQYTRIRHYTPYWRPFLHPQPEDAPCRGDTDPLITD